MTRTATLVGATADMIAALEAMRRHRVIGIRDRILIAADMAGRTIAEDKQSDAGRSVSLHPHAILGGASRIRLRLAETSTPSGGAIQQIKD